jgi:CheY-like chemotaxis protein
MDVSMLLSWITVFILFLGIGLLFIYYAKLKRVRNTEKELIVQRQKIEQEHYALASEKREKHTSLDVKNEETGHTLLGNSESLIEFLRLKSKKITISKEKFNLNNVLNEISGSLATDFPGKDIGLIFDIDKSVPRYLTGDSLYLGQVLTSLIKSSIEKGLGKEIKLEIVAQQSSSSIHELRFRIIDMSTKLPDKKAALLTMPHYDEETNSYVGLELFVANELVILMHGKLSVEVSQGQGKVYTLTLPFNESDWAERRKYRLPSKDMVGKHILLCDENDNAALALEGMFKYFKYEVTIVPFETFLQKRIDMSDFDIVVLDEKLFSHHVNKYIEVLKKEKGLKIIGLRNIFLDASAKVKSEIIDKYLSKPLSQERVYEAIIDIYTTNKSVEKSSFQSRVESITKNITPDKQTHREHFEEKPNVTTKSFADFAGKNLLIVEDNIINQKILSNVLAASGMHIKIANNGQEAVDILFEKEASFDIVLMDINMPIMDGYIATSLIRENEYLHTLPIIALTALVLESEITKMFDHGISGYLSKPLKIGKLYTAFEYFLGKTERVQERPENNVEKVLELDGLDSKQGIVYADGNDALYREVLSEFLSAYGHTDSILRNLVDEQKHTEIKMLCSDMRSLTKTIGAYKMHDVSDRMYKLFLYNNQHMIPKYAEEYGRELSKLRLSIQAYIGG